MLDSRAGGGDFASNQPRQQQQGYGQQNSQQQSSPQNDYQQQSAPNQQQSGPKSEPVGAGDFSDFDDDIPF